MSRWMESELELPCESGYDKMIVRRAVGDTMEVAFQINDGPIVFLKEEAAIKLMERVIDILEGKYDGSKH